MRRMTFSKIYLLSPTEKSAFWMEFDPNATVIQAGNGFGKSAILKSLYDAFGAVPHRIDETWRAGNVVTAVDFEIDKRKYTIVTFAGTYTVFDDKQNKLLHTAAVGAGLAPFFADLLDFRLLMLNKKDTVIIPPPAYAFAPFYIDQDKSWSAVWQSFTSMYLPKSAPNLAEYHSGLKPNEYYIAQAEKDHWTALQRESMSRQKGLLDALEHLGSIDPSNAISFNLDNFKHEIESLVQASNDLLKSQTEYKLKLRDLNEARSLWQAQASVLNAAIAECNEVFGASIVHAVDVECPTCGEHYSNDIIAKFRITSETESMMTALAKANTEIRKLDGDITTVADQTREIEGKIYRIDSLLAARRGEVSFNEIVNAEGRNQARSSLRTKVEALHAEIGKQTTQIKSYQREMKKSQDKDVQKDIKSLFYRHLVDFSTKLDVRPPAKDKASLTGANLSRGSAGPRGLLAYYYAFLHTVSIYGSSAFCPIVVDAPNQQGQDAGHLPEMINLLIHNRPEDSQLILAVEDLSGVDVGDAEIYELTGAKEKLLEEALYDEVNDHLSPYLILSLNA